MTRFLTAVVGALLLTGCGDERELREWTPEDHGQPPQGQMDPTRIPGQSNTGTPAERAASALWIMQCAGCHGRGGRGDGPEQPPGSQMEDFTRAEFQASRTDEELAAVIVTGRGLMPEFGDQLPEQAVQALVGHIRRLGPQQPPEQPAPEQPTPEQPAPEPQPTPEQPAPAPQPTPEQPAPEQPAPEQPAPAPQPTPEQPAPQQGAPSQ